MYSILGGSYLLEITLDITWSRIFDKKNPKFWYLLNPFSWCRNRKPRGNSHLGDYLSRKWFPDHRESEKWRLIEALRQLILSRGELAITWLHPEVSIHRHFRFIYFKLPDDVAKTIHLYHLWTYLTSWIATLDKVKDVRITFGRWQHHFSQRIGLELSWLPILLCILLDSLNSSNIPLMRGYIILHIC